MKITNVLLSIIAACLVFQVAHSFIQKPIPVIVQTQERTAAPTGTLDVRLVGIADKLDQIFQPSTQTPIPVIVQNQLPTPSGTLNVKIVGVSDTLKVDIANVGGKALDEVDGQIVLPVGVRNTVDANIKGTVETDIKGVDGKLADFGQALPVVDMH